MAVYSAAQIAAVAKSAGFKGTDLETAVAVALAESSGRTDVVNYLGCVGLWQIYRKVHQSRHPLWTEDWLKNPSNNAIAAFQIWRDAGDSWRPWSTYTSGSYRRFQSQARQASTTIGILPGGVSPLAVPSDSQQLIDGGAIVDKFQSIGDFIKLITDPHTQLRIAYVLIGIVLIIIGLLSISRAGDKIVGAAKLATDVLPQTRVAKVASKVSKVVK